MKTPIAKTLHLCALLVLTAGCAVGPDYVRPETDTTESWSESLDARLSADPVATNKALGGGWETEQLERTQQ